MLQPPPHSTHTACTGVPRPDTDHCVPTLHPFPEIAFMPFPEPRISLPTLLPQLTKLHFLSLQRPALIPWNTLEKTLPWSQHTPSVANSTALELPSNQHQVPLGLEHFLPLDSLCLPGTDWEFLGVTLPEPPRV